MSEVKLAAHVGLAQSGRLSFLLKDTVVYGGATAISQACSLITFPLLTRRLSVTDYGVLDYFMLLSSFLATLFIFGQDSAVARYFYEYEEKAKRCQLISQSLIFQLLGLALLLPLLWGCSEWLTGLLIESTDSVRLFKIVLLQLPFLLLINFSQNIFKWTFDRSRFLTMSLGFALLRASLLGIAVLEFDAGIEGVLLVSLLICAVFGMLGLLLVRQWLVRPTDFIHIRQMLRYAMPFGFICALSGLSPTLDRTLTNQVLGAVDLGLYSAGTKVAMMIGMVVGAFQTAWGPFSLSIYKKNDAGDTYNWVLKLFVASMCGLVFALTIVAQPLVSMLASDRYAGSVVVVFPLAMGLAIQATSWITEIGIGISKRSYLNIYAYTFGVVATVISILLLAPDLGILGVALGVMIGHTAKAIISSWLAQRAYPLPWQYLQVSMALGSTLVIGLLAIWIDHQLGTQAYTLVLGAGLFAVLGMSWGVLLDASERQQLTMYVRNRFAKVGSHS